MKIVNPKEISAREKEAFAHGVSEEELMENAGSGVARYVNLLMQQNHLQQTVLLLCGKGNNGGDAFVAGRHLIRSGYKVKAILLQNQLSPLCQKNRKAFLDVGGEMITFSEVEKGIRSFGLILDGLFGTGFSGSLEGEIKKLVQFVNGSGIPIIAIDIPSGLNGETGEVAGPVIRSLVTLTLTAPKSGFYLDQGWNYIGQVETVNIGLPEKYYLELDNEFDLLEKRNLPKLLPPIIRNRHKYQRGHVVIFAGSPGMTGSAFLSAYGAFRGGAGYVQLLIREGMENAYHELPELLTPNASHKSTDEIVELMNSASAVVIGPGFGREEEELNRLETILSQLEVPAVLDADALYLLATRDVEIPEESLLTPHHGEMSKLLKKEKTPPFNREFIQEAEEYAKAHHIHILLKGAPTFYISPHGEKPIVIPFGDPGMATAGCGDLLSGIVGALVAQKLSLKDAALLGASLHGIAGELAKTEVTSYCMKTMDVAGFIPNAFKNLFTP